MKIFRDKSGRIKKGSIPPMKGKFKEDAPYRQLHKWIRRNYGSAYHCQNLLCRKESSFYDWAKLPEVPYNHNINNYLQLCRKCHKAMDVKKEKIIYEI